MTRAQRAAGTALLTVAVTSAAMAARAQGPAEVVIRQITVVDGDGRLRPDHDIVVRGTRIARMAPAGSPLPPAKTTIDGRGKFAIAGLIDADVRTAPFTPVTAQALLAWGITSIADRGGDPARLERWRHDLATGRLYAPKIAPPCQGRAGLAAASAPDASDALHDALARLVATGQSPSKALATFTRDNARALCLDGVGEIAAGQTADLVVLTADPLQDIRHTREIDAVVFRGEVLTQAHIRMLRRGTLPLPTP